MVSYEDIWNICSQCERDTQSVERHQQLIDAINAVDDSEGATIVVADRLLGLGQPAIIRAMIANQLLEVIARSRALQWSEGDEPEVLLVRSKCLALMGELQEAAAIYAQLKSMNPELSSRSTEGILGSAGLWPDLRK